jgi:hypothetical protein
VLGASRDGSTVYFVAHGALTPGASGGRNVYNVYVWRSGALSLVATLHYGDYSSDPLFGFTEDRTYNNVEVSPSGRYLTFESTEALTGYNTTPSTPGVCEVPIPEWNGSIYTDGTGRCIEMFEYDAESAKLVCASCDPRGLPPDGDSVSPMAVHSLALYSGWQSTTVQQRFVLDDGRLFFDSNDALLPQASDGRENVYEYEPQGAGSCQRSGGCIGLISSGTSSDDSYFVDTGTNGDDAFFMTRQQLVAQDGDEAIDLYDARVGGGFASATPPPCGGEACRPPNTPAPPIYGAPASAAFVGPGNPQPAATVAPAKKQTAKQKTKKTQTKKKAHKHKAKPKSKRKQAASKGRAAGKSSTGHALRAPMSTGGRRR